MLFVKFLKTNWFAIGAILIVLTAFARKNPHILPGGAPSEKPPKRPEFFTDKDKIASASHSLSGWKTGETETFQAPSEEQAMAFIQRFSKTAVGERSKFGIPASAILAAGMVNSFSGRREIAFGSNNFFALPCSPKWGGMAARSNGKCFRRYDTAWDSFRDFSREVSAAPSISKLKKSRRRDPQVWLQKMEAAGLSDVQNFSVEAMRLVKKYRLTDLDK